MTLVLDLPSDLETKLEAEAKQRGVTLNEYALQKLTETIEIPTDQEIHPLIRLSEKIHASMPEEEWTKLPPDYATNYKHHLHGYPKVNE